LKWDLEFFDNVITYETEQKKENWQRAIFMLEDFTLKNKGEL